MTTTLISVFTPSHDDRFLDDCYKSLAAQTHKAWEWVVLLNGDAAEGPCWLPPADDKRVKVSVSEAFTEDGMIGHFKGEAVALCRGDVLLELDHDDVLATTALAEVASAYRSQPDAGMYYSQFAQLDEAGKPAKIHPYDEADGWLWRETTVDGFTFEHPVALPVTPHNLGYIWFSPNHLRAFTRVAYDKAGGYSGGVLVDDQDLMCRLYQVGPFHLIDRCLYGQRTYDGQSQADPAVKEAIWYASIALYDRYFEAMALTWAERAGLACLDLGGAHGDSDPRYLRVDQHAGAGVDVAHTFPAPLRDPSKPKKRTNEGMVHPRWKEGTVGVIRAVDFLEHVQDKIALINELHRLLAPGGVLITQTPSTDDGQGNVGRGAWQDPEHVAFYNEHSFWYYTNPDYARFNQPRLTARFHSSRLVTYFESPWHRENRIPYVACNLIAIKGSGQPRQGGPSPWL